MAKNNFETIGRDIANAIQDATKDIDKKKIKQWADEFAKKAETEKVKYTKRSWKEYDSTNKPMVRIDAYGYPIAPYKTKSILMRVWGTAVGLPSFFMSLYTLGTVPFGYGGFLSALIGLFFFLPLTVVGLWVAIKGFRLEGARSRFANYWEALKDRGFASIQKLSTYVDKSPNFIRKEIKFMVEQRFFEAGRFIGPEDTLVINRPNYLAYQKQQALEEQKRKELEMPVQEEKEEITEQTPEAILEEAKGYLVQLRTVEENIENAYMKSSVVRLGRITTNIFDYVSKNPHKLSKIRKFMNYYLPTTVKLVQSYALLEDQEVSGTNIESSKQRIEESMQVINTSFERLLDELFQKEALDIHADLIAMETMMARDGLGGKDFVRMEMDEGEIDE